MNEAVEAAKTASSEFSALAPTQTLGTLGNNSVVKATTEFNVVDVSAVQLTNGTLTLEGNSSSVFVINVAGNFSTSNAGVVLSGGVLAKNVVWNIGGSMTITGGGLETYFGTALVLHGEVNVHDKIWEGTIIGATITDTSGFRVNPFPPAHEPAFTIEKLQKLSGEFTKAELQGQIGETVHYKIIVKNTGNMLLKFGPLTDAKCTNIVPSGPTELKPGESETFTCEHLLTTVGRYTNTGTIEGNEGTGSKTSNEVVVNVPEEPKPSRSSRNSGSRAKRRLRRNS